MIPQCCERLLVIKKYYLKLLVLKVSLQSVVSDVVSQINFHRIAESPEKTFSFVYIIMLRVHVAGKKPSPPLSIPPCRRNRNKEIALFLHRMLELDNHVFILFFHCDK